MEILFFILFFILFICLIVGLVRPRLVLGFFKGDKTRKNVILIFGISAALFFFLCGSVTTPPSWLEKTSKQETSPIDNEETTEETKIEKESIDKAKEEKPEVYTASIGGIAKTDLLQLTFWGDGAISMNVPVGWNVYTGGECATKSILARDALSELKQVFYFSEAGPVYSNQESKQRDQNYIAMGGVKLPWFESPIVDPLTAENFLVNFEALAQVPFFQQVFPQVPIMTNIKIINSEKITNRSVYITDAKLIRAEFQQNGKSGEGYFYIITADIAMGQGYSLGYGMMFIGITAPKGLLDLITPSLKESLESYTISQEYITACINAGNKAVAGILEAGDILNESSDTIMNVWVNKLESEQRMSEKYSDAILGKSRLYNSNTDEVYEITPEFYDFYQVHSDEFEMSDLEHLPDNKWGHAPLNGAEHIK